ncbi:late competence development ComFB family protein [Coleofasciculus sp. FACHB-SPT9]|uniref:late competence development ComFB family protein n=1 Tax=Cyanophyceae TaxID=3028117 RepID=UPI001686D6DA|nr:late competence development ComFB family protein [Coleofasciculus sp. FACHB-SPT9]
MSLEKLTIGTIVEQALQNGYMTPSLAQEIGSICEISEISVDDYIALDRLFGQLLTDEAIAIPGKQFINVMEALVLIEASVQVLKMEVSNPCLLDLGEIAAYALNRLPPLYATTEEGASFQRQRGKEELRELITQKVKEAIARSPMPG